MNDTMRLIRLDSIADLRGAADRWDELWSYSDVAMPTFRAEPLAGWLEQFAPQSEFRALVVENGRRWIAALPLVQRTFGRVLSGGVLPSNEWSANGEFLLDPSADARKAAELLVGAADKLPCQLLRFDEIDAGAPRWKALAAAVDSAGMEFDCREQMQIGRIEIDRDFDAYRKTWSPKHRQGIARRLRRLAAEGRVAFSMRSAFEPGEIRRLVREGFEVEDRSWKGEAGTSVLQTPGMFDFYLGQAELLAHRGQLELAFLRCNRRPIAFAYGYSAKGIYYSIKIGYDRRFAAFGPGQLLRYHVLKRLFSEPHRRAIEYIAPTAAHRRWKPSYHKVSRLTVAPGGLLGRMALQAYRKWRRSRSNAPVSSR